MLIPPERPQASGIVSVKHDDAPTISAQLDKRAVFVTLRRHPLTNTDSVLRFGVPFFISADEIDRAAEEMRDILRAAFQAN